MSALKTILLLYLVAQGFAMFCGTAYTLMDDSRALAAVECGPRKRWEYIFFGSVVGCHFGVWLASPLERE